MQYTLDLQREISKISLLALFTNTVLPYSVFKHANNQMPQTRHISMHMYNFILFIVAILQPTEPLIHTPVLTSVLNVLAFNRWIVMDDYQ